MSSLSTEMNKLEKWGNCSRSFLINGILTVKNLSSYFGIFRSSKTYEKSKNITLEDQFL